MLLHLRLAFIAVVILGAWGNSFAMDTCEKRSVKIVKFNIKTETHFNDVSYTLLGSVANYNSIPCDVELKARVEDTKGNIIQIFTFDANDLEAVEAGGVAYFSRWFGFNHGRVKVFLKVHSVEEP